MPKLALCMIIKDDSEVEGLKRALVSVIDYVDSVHVVANGQETTNIEHLMRFTQEKYPTKETTFNYLKWNNDFSEQRNYSFSLAPKDTDYILWLDTDDVFVGGQHLRQLATQAKASNHDVVFLKYWYGCTFKGKPSIENLVDVDIEHYRERLIKPGAIEWKKRVHETPVPVTGSNDRYTKVPYHPEHNPIAVAHMSTIDDAMGKLERNQVLLEAELKDERADRGPDPRTILYLMKIYAESNDRETLERCIEMGHEYLSLSGWDEERANACDLMAICHTKLDQNQEAVKFLHAAIEEYPHEPLHYIRLCLAYFNLGKYNQARHWLNIAGQLDLDDKTAGIRNIKEMKVLFAQAHLKLAYNAEKDIVKAYEMAKVLLKEQPTPENEENLAFIADLHDLFRASEDAKKLIDYLESIEDTNIISILDKLPLAISEQPWAIGKRRSHTPPRIWADNEICYFANFGGKHFEKWDSHSLQTGIGGSETAVIELAKQWADDGYKVTIYGDPLHMGEQGGVIYLPWYYFNKGDKFNVFIQWRSGALAPFIKAKRFYVDLHDIVAPVDYPESIVNAVDGVLFKSQYHRDMLPSVPDEKALIISNGIIV